MSARRTNRIQRGKNFRPVDLVLVHRRIVDLAPFVWDRPGPGFARISDCACSQSRALNPRAGSRAVLPSRWVYSRSNGTASVLLFGSSLSAYSWLTVVKPESASLPKAGLTLSGIRMLEFRLLCGHLDIGKFRQEREQLYD